MGPLLKISRLIDAISNLVGRTLIWLVLAATLISAGNAIVRKTLNIGSNAMLEIQWYLYAAVFMLGGGYALLKNTHVRIDVLSNKFSARTRAWVDIGGIVIFLLPMCYLLSVFAWPIVMSAIETGEVSSNAGGLIRWPLYALVPAGFGLLALQGLSELIKRIAFLRGAGTDPMALPHDPHADSGAAPDAPAAKAGQ